MKGEKQNMNKFLTKVAKIFLGLSMAAGVGVAIGSGRKDASPAHAASTATYTVSTVTSLTPSGNPTGSSHTFSTNGALNSGAIQLAGKSGTKSFTLTLTGYGGYKITALSVNAKSNKSSGNGSLTLVAGSTTLADSGGYKNFNDAFWYGGWSQSAVTCNITLSNSSYTIGNNESVVLTISNSANSIYIYSVAFTYEVASTPATSVTITGNDGTSLAPSETRQLGTTVLPAGHTDTITWSSSDNNVATVSSTGLVTAVADGTATITARANASVANTTTITVETPTTPFILPTKNSTSGYTGTNESLSFTYGNVSNLSITSSNTSYVTIGTISASAGSGTVQLNFVGAGTTTVKFKDGTTELASVSVTVTASSVSITGLPASSSVYTGNTLDLGSLISVTATGSYSNAVTWTSGDDSIATVDASGVVTGVAEGDVNITVTSSVYPSATMTCAVSVSEQPGTADKPYTVTQARAAIDADTGLTNAYTRGIVYQVDSYSDKYHSITYWISDDGTSTNPLEVYSGKGIGGADFSSVNDIKVNDIVTVKGTLKKFNSTYEYDYNNELVTLVRKELSSIAVSGQTSSFYVGETFTFGGTVTASYTDSTSADVTASATITPPDLSSTGNKTVNVSYTEGGIEKTTSYTVTVNSRTLSSISVSTAPTKVTYAAGECFDPTDLVITTVWNVGSNGSVAYNDHSSDFSFLPTLETALKKTDKSVTITYGGKSTTQAITVSEVDRYQLIKSTSDLVSGATYLIGGSGDDNGYFISNNQASNNRTATTGTVTNEIVNITSSMQVITLGGSAGAWTLYATGGSNEGYLYTATTGSNRLHTRASDSDNNSKWAITVSDAGVATIHNVGNTSKGEMAYNANNGSPIFACYGTGGNLSIYKLIDNSESVTISKSSVSGLKTDTDDTVSITANNFTPEDIEVSYSVANVAAVTKGTIENGVIPLNVAFTGIGTTVATITVTGGESDYDAELTITVAAKPDSLVVSGNGITLVDGGQTVANRRLEIQTGAEKQFSASHFTMIDTDENNMSATANDVTLSRTSGDDVVTFSGAKITAGSTPGSCVVRFASKLVSSVYYEITVNVVADYNVSVNSITYNDDLVDDQGHTLDISEIFKTKVANTHFDSTAPILDSELKFSYDDNDYANAVSADSFVYDFAHGTTSVAFGEGYKDQTVFVYTTFTKSRVSSFEITIAQADNPLISISLDTGNSYNLQRNTTHQLVVSFNPSDTTDNRDVVYSLSNSSTGSTITVSSTGLISAGSKVGSVATVTATVDPDQNPETENSVSASVVVTVTREAMTLTADMPASYVKVTSTSELTSGKYLIVSAASNVVMTEAVNSTANKTTYENIDSSLDSYCFTYNASTGSLKGPNGSYIGKTASGNGMDVGSTEYTHTITFDNGDAVITASGGSILRYNTSWGGFRYYGSGQQAVQLYKQSGGETEVTVTDALFNIVDSAMSLKSGSSSLYDLGLCNALGTSFNVSAWNTLGNSFTSSIISDNKLAYASADENGNEIEQFLAVYDYVIGKKESGYAAYASANDFLGRVASGKITASPRVNPLVNIVGENTNTVAIIVIISMVSVTAIGGYFFLRKRKENI